MFVVKRARSVAQTFVWALLVLASGSQAATNTTPGAGIRKSSPNHLALTGARIVVSPGQVIESGTLVIRDGRVVSVRSGHSVPEGASELQMQGRSLYPAFIEPFASVGLAETLRAGAIKPTATPGDVPQHQQATEPGARHWNRRVRPELQAAQLLSLKADEIKALRALGFAAAQAAPQAGIFRGRGAVISLRDATLAEDALIEAQGLHQVGFDFAIFPASEYPGSLMGAIALIRQTLIDARWYAEAANARGLDAAERPAANAALESLGGVVAGRERVLMAMDDELDHARLDRIVREFSLDAVMLGTGHEYRILEQIKAAKRPMVLPIALPEVPEVETLEQSLSVSLAELLHWEQAPANAARVAAAGIDFSLTTHGLKEPAKQFWPTLRTLVAQGLGEQAALAALTTAPARLLGLESELGSLEPGRRANFLVADAGLLSTASAKLHEVWVDGQRTVINDLDLADPAGVWMLDWAGAKGPAEIEIKRDGESFTGSAGETRFKLKRDGRRLLALVPASLFGSGEGKVSLEAHFEGDDRLAGTRTRADGTLARWQASRKAATPVVKPASTDTPSRVVSMNGYPSGEYARHGLPEQPRALLVRNARIWTNTKQGVLESADLLVEKGRIVAVGNGLKAPRGAQEIDATGLHLTPGIIDAHSHTAIARNVNEPSHAVTVEVRVGDVLDPTDIDLYRQLAGGVTTAQLLHGSANPMGGQSQVIKLRWGADAEGLKFDGAPAGVKFALGENVKQSGWGDAFVTRYPQSRLGVEQVMRDTFNAALEYGAARDKAGRKPFRRDLRMEAALAIAQREIGVHIHSYRQDEILMFARLAADHQLKVSTFQHVLEGYKVADAIKEIGAGASTFSDWWAYKMEVYDGTPYNAALMARTGVVTSFNSDSNELARRLNTEAAKAIKYGGLEPAEALKLVTLNPAIQLGISDRVGAIAPGMDADFVLWTHSPLSNYARVDQTWIDGRRYFDREQDRRDYTALLAERERLLQKALPERIKAIALEDAKPEAKPASKPEAAPTQEWVHWAAGRSIYHDGGNLMGCSVQGHGH